MQHTLSFLVCWPRLTILLVMGLSLGCGEPDSIRRYQVPSEQSPAAPRVEIPPAESQRMLAAMIADGGQVWFVKLMGPAEPVGRVADGFQQLVESIRWADDPAEPTWDLPEGWAQRPGDARRFATLVADGLETSVSSLPNPSADWDGYVLANLNRWRGQLQLAPISAEQLSQAIRRSELDGRPTVWVDLLGGTSPPSSQPSAVAGGRPSVAPGNSTARSATAPLQYDVPDGWQPGRTSSFRLATFDLERDGQQAEVTLIPLSGDWGTLLANVNRWRKQAGLDAIDENELENSVRKVTVDGIESSIVEILPPDESPAASAILVAIIPRPDRTLFVKLMGDRKLASDEKSNFEAFVHSIRFPETP